MMVCKLVSEFSSAWEQRLVEGPVLLRGKLGIFSEIDEQLDFNETLIYSSVFDVVKMDNIRFFWKSLFKNLSAFKVINSYVIVKKIKL